MARRVVERIIPEGGVAIGEPVRAACTVKVCAKKNCWRSGGKELLSALRAEAAADGLTDRVKFEAVGCLDRCQMPPNADTPWREYCRCTPHDVRAILAEVAHRFGAQHPDR